MMFARRHGWAWVGVVACLLVGAAATAGIVTEYKFENGLLDTGANSTVGDTLAGRDTANSPVTPTYAAGVSGRAVQISRTAGQAALLFANDSADLDVPATYTLEAFVRPTFVPGSGGEFQRVLCHWFGTPNEYHFGIRGSNVDQYHEQAGGAQVEARGGTVTAGQWTHIAATADGAGTIRVWLNGIQVGSVAYNNTIGNANTQLILGQWFGDLGGGGAQYQGLVDEVRLHNTAESASYLRERAALLSPQAPNPPVGLRAFYEFEGNGQDTARNYIPGQGALGSAVYDHLTAVGSVSYAAGRDGQAARLSGGYFTAPNSADIRLPATFTIEAWVNPDSVPVPGWRRLVLNWGAQNAYHFAIRDGGVSLYIRETDGNAFEVAFGGTVVAGQWQHLAAVLDAATLTGKVYLNGVLVGSGAFDGTLTTATTEGLGIGDSVGGPSSGARYAGLIDDLALWSVALTADQLRSHFFALREAYGLELPEPTTCALLGLGGLTLLRRRRLGRTH